MESAAFDIGFTVHGIMWFISDTKISRGRP